MPNLLTIGRICLAPFLVSAVLEGKFLLGFVLFVVAGLTDALDGTLARVLKQRTVLGQYLDPVADKLLLSTLFLVLTHMNFIPVRVTVTGFWPRSWDTGGRGDPLRGGRAARFQAQRLRKSQYAGADHRGGCVFCSPRSTTRTWVVWLRALAPRRHRRAHNRLGTALCMAHHQAHASPGMPDGSATGGQVKVVVRNLRSRFPPVRPARFPRFPYREILQNQRLRHTPGIRQIRCRRAGRRCALAGVCRRLPWFQVRFEFGLFSNCWIVESGFCHLPGPQATAIRFDRRIDH